MSTEAARTEAGPVDACVLVVEDDAAVRDVLALLLRAAGADVVMAGDGPEGIHAFEAGSFDLVLLDIMLPRIDGFDVCREIRRRSSVPIIILTAKTATADLVKGLELGADDYVTKPLEGPELIARMRAVLRRAGPAADNQPIVVGDLVLDPAAHTAQRGDEPIPLTPIEFRLLVELARNAGLVLSREALLERVWNYDYLGDSRLVDMAIKRVRDKIERGPEGQRRISTVRGVGYRMELA